MFITLQNYEKHVLWRTVKREFSTAKHYEARVHPDQIVSPIAIVSSLRASWVERKCVSHWNNKLPPRAEYYGLHQKNLQDVLLCCNLHLACCVLRMQRLGHSSRNGEGTQDIVANEYGQVNWWPLQHPISTSSTEYKCSSTPCNFCRPCLIFLGECNPLISSSRESKHHLAHTKYASPVHQYETERSH